MKITINGKEQELNFGVRFVRELDKVAGMEAGGMSLGMGLTKSLPALNAYDPAVLSDVIYSATFRNSPRVGRNDVDDYLDGNAQQQSKRMQLDTSIPNSTFMRGMVTIELQIL